MTGVDDLELFQRWAEGDAGAGQALVLRYYDAVCFFFASKLADHPAMELTWDTFETICTKAASLPLHSSFAAYLYGIARWKLVAHVREQRARGFDPLTDPCPTPGPGSSVAALLRRRPAEARLVEALGQLPLDDQLLLELRLYEGLQLREIAEILGVSKERITGRLAAAKQRLVRAAEGVTSIDETLASLTTHAKDVRAALTRRPGSVEREEGPRVDE